MKGYRIELDDDGLVVRHHMARLPLAMYKRIIEASSNPGDMVLDPFAGCATTSVAAEQLDRQWIGVDINEEAEDVIRERLHREVNASLKWNDIVRVLTTPPDARTTESMPRRSCYSSHLLHKSQSCPSKRRR